MEKFIIRAYTKSELALRYFPTTADPHVAVNHLMAWIDRCRPLAEAPSTSLPVGQWGKGMQRKAR